MSSKTIARKGINRREERACRHCGQPTVGYWRDEFGGGFSACGEGCAVNAIEETDRQVRERRARMAPKVSIVIA